MIKHRGSNRNAADKLFTPDQIQEIVAFTDKLAIAA